MLAATDLDVAQNIRNATAISFTNSTAGPIRSANPPLMPGIAQPPR